MNEQISRTAVLEIKDGFTTKNEWENTYMFIRKKAYEMGVKYPVVLASTTTGRVYVFERGKVEEKPFSPITPGVA